jgi:endonuclease/exonuclease/phosphatase family metal-dependent hydrolase
MGSRMTRFGLSSGALSCFNRAVKNSLRLAQFNVENLFALVDHIPAGGIAGLSDEAWLKLSTSTIRNKPLDQVKALARTVRDLNADILMLCEVGGRESMQNFNHYFLNDEYIPHLIEGNSDRGIDLGYLVRKSLPFQYDLLSHKSRSIDFLYPHEKLNQETGFANRVTSHRFSRDVLELRIFAKGEPRPALILLLVHLKSQLDRDRIDPFGRDRRKAELEKLVKIYLEIEGEFQGQVPIVLSGDFNGVVGLDQHDPEFAALYKQTDLRDVLEIAAVPMEERFTHMQIFNYGSPQNKQLDYIFVSPPLQSKVVSEGTFVYRFKDAHGMTVSIPQSLAAKRLLPSDHYPVVTTLKDLEFI